MEPLDFSTLVATTTKKTNKQKPINCKLLERKMEIKKKMIKLTNLIQVQSLN